MTNPATGPHLGPGPWASLGLAAALVAVVVAAILTIGP
jgi:hypothetical protein